MLAAVALEVKDAGAVPIVVESPGAGIIPSPKVLARQFVKAGYQDVADRYGFEHSVEPEWDWVPCPDGRAFKRVEIVRSALQVDGLINIPKFKTHALMIFTGATKNLFGLIPGLTKVGYHGKFPEKELFAEMLLDVATLMRPRLNVMDAIVAMEGHGPGTGRQAPEAGPDHGRRRHGVHGRRLLRHRRLRSRRPSRCWSRPGGAVCGTGASPACR